MRMSSRALLVCFALGLAAFTGCGDDDDDDSPTSGSGGSGAKSGSGGAAGKSGAGGKAGGGSDAGKGGGGGGTLCSKYGGKDNVGKVIEQKVVPELLADCRINAYFVDLTAARKTHLSDCLAIQAQELFGCPDVKYQGSKSSSGSECRSMKAAHVGLGLSEGDLDALLEDVGKGLKAGGVSDADIGTAAAALLGFKGDIVETDDPKTPTQDECDDAGI
jgi:hypothetical protein